MRVIALDIAKWHLLSAGSRTVALFAAGLFLAGLVQAGAAQIHNGAVGPAGSDPPGAVPLGLPVRENTKLIAADAGGRFGYSVALSGDTAVVGARGGFSPRSGVDDSAHVFARDQGGSANWGEVQELVPGDASNHFGASVAISGDTVVVGAPSVPAWPDPLGTAHVFERNQGGADRWGEVKKIVPEDAAQYEFFGAAVAISGDVVVVGSPVYGAARVFERSHGGPDNWGQVQRLAGSDPAGGFGGAVAVAGDLTVIGAPGESSNTGSVHLFERDQGGAGNWGQVATLTASDAAANDQFGRSVALFGATVIVGAPQKLTGAGIFGGAVYVFEPDQANPGVWLQTAKLTGIAAAQEFGFGTSVALAGDTLLAGAPRDGGFRNDTGSVYLFERNQGGTGNWGRVKRLVASDAAADDEFGFSVASSGDTAVLGTGGSQKVYIFGSSGPPRPPPPAASGYYVLDGFGGVHPGGDAPVLSPLAPYFGFDVAQDLELASVGYYVLDRFGGVHPGGGAPAMSQPTSYWGRDAARDLELAPTGFYVLDLFGGVHAGGRAGVLWPPPPYFGFDIAKDLELGLPGYYVLDGFGGFHASGGAEVLSPTTPYFGFDVARDVEMSGSGYYVLDGYGGIHTGGGATPIVQTTPYFGWDVAEDLELVAAGYYMLDAWGALHAGGGAPVLIPDTEYFRWDIARDFELR